MRQKLTALVLTMVLIGGGVPHAKADCCDDLISCAAAVVTSGMSCLVIETINVVKHCMGLLQTALDNTNGATERAIADAKRAVDDEIAEIQSHLNQSNRQLNQSLALANEIRAKEARSRTNEVNNAQ